MKNPYKWNTRIGIAIAVLAFAVGFMVCDFAHAATYGPYDATVTRNIDGDSIDVAIDSYPQDIKMVELRAPGVNAPEMHPRFGCTSKKLTDAQRAACISLANCEKAAAQKAADYTARVFPVGAKVKIININPGDTKYYGRLSADMLTADGTVQWSKALLQSGNARPYHGGTRHPWCKQ